jgi:adenylate kinase
MNIDTIFFIGPQGSGKGTQAKFLAKHLGFFYWEMGGILREVAAGDTILGIKIKQLLDSGVLLSDDDLYQVVKLRLNEIPLAKGVVFDGIPRRLGQADFLLNYLKSQGRTSFATFHIDLPKEESIKRLLKRAEVEKRADDTLEKINFRLEQYQNATIPVIDFLKQNTEFFYIDGSPSIYEVTKSINKSLGI